VAWPSDLRSLQHRFLALVTGSGGVEETLQQLGATPADLASVVVGDDKLDQVGRMDIYADMYFARLVDVVRDDFPRLARVLGEEPFSDLVRDFLVAFPPDGAPLRHLAAPLPGFVPGHRLVAARPWLAELAQLEWNRADVFDAADAATLTLTQLQRLPAEAFAELPLRLVPAHRLWAVHYGVEGLWRRLGPGGEEPVEPVEPAPGHLLVWRKGTEVLHRRPEPEEAELLAPLAAGSTFGRVCERLGEGRSVEEAAGLAFPLLCRWSEDRLLRAPDRLK
jgi:hypothetical protein